MKEVINKIILIIICCITFFFSILFLFNKKELFSYEENRYLSNFELNNIESYVNDHFPFRTKLISLKNKFEIFIGKTLINDTYIGKEGYLIPTFTDNNNKKLIIDTVNNFSSNKKVDVMIIPDSILINEDKLYYHLPVKEKEEINYLYSKLKNTNNINIINSLKIINNKNNNMYFKSDHHWTTHGAFIAYQEYIKNKNMELKNNFNIVTISNNYKGTSSSKVLGFASEEDIDLFITNNSLTVEYVYEKKTTSSLYNFDYLSKKDKYALFLDNNHALINITNNSINNNNSIVLIKNSYANSFVPFIVNNYKYIYIIDLRYFGDSVSKFVDDNNVNDILILYNLNNLYSDMSIIKLK
jgi:hypothetical protein